MTMTRTESEEETLRFYPDGKMTQADYARLAACEAVISAGMQTFRDVGAALLEIRDEKLYRMDYETFADYLQQRWRIKSSQGYRLMAAAQVVQDLSPIGDILPTNEAQARPLVQLPTAEERQEVWKEAVEAANGQTPTGAQVAAAVERRKEPNTPDVDAWMGEAKPVPEPPAERPETAGLLRTMEPRPEPDESDYDVVATREKIPEPPLSWEERALFHLDVALEALRAAVGVIPEAAPEGQPVCCNFRGRLEEAMVWTKEVVDEVKESAMVHEDAPAPPEPAGPEPEAAEEYQPGQRVWINIRGEEWVTGRIVETFGSDRWPLVLKDGWQTPFPEKPQSLRPYREEDEAFSEAMPLAATKGKERNEPDTAGHKHLG